MAAAGCLQDRSHALQAWMWLINKNPHIHTHTHTSSVKTCLLWLRILNFITTMVQLEIFSGWLYTVFAWNIRSPTGRAWPFRCWVPRTSSLRWVKGVSDQRARNERYGLLYSSQAGNTRHHASLPGGSEYHTTDAEIRVGGSHWAWSYKCLAMSRQFGIAKK